MKKKKAEKLKRKLIGEVGVDSGQLMLCDPCYIDSEWNEEEYKSEPRVYRDTHTKELWGYEWTPGSSALRVNRFPGNFVTPIPECEGQTPNELIANGRWQRERIAAPPCGNFSYNAACRTTNSEQGAGQLNYKLGHPGVAVAFRSGYGDGVYPVYATYNDEGRIIKVEVEMG